MSLLTDEEREFLFNEASFLKGLPRPLIAELISIANVAVYPKDGYVTHIGDMNSDFFLVISGVISVNACSSSGKQITFLRVKAGEVYNMLSPYIDTPRFLEARAVSKTRCLWVKGRDYFSFVQKHPPLAARMFEIIGRALDAANSRILDLMEKSVDERIKRVLNTLHAKFDSPIMITAVEIADIAGTTTESVLRTLSKLRKLNIIETQRGKIWINEPETLRDSEFGELII